MRRVHFSLRPSFNLTLVAVYTSAVGALLFFRAEFIFMALALGAGFGTLAGILQRRAFVGSETALLNATDALAIRRVLTARRSGRFSIWLIWINPLLAAAVQLAIHHDPIWGIPAAYVAFALARDILTLPLCYKLAAQSH